MFLGSMWVLTLRCGGWPPFPVPRPQGGFPRREAAWEKCDAGEVAVHLWRRVRSSLGKCLPVRSKRGLQPAALQRRERANRERRRNGRELDDEREWKSWLPNWITPSFFSLNVPLPRSWRLSIFTHSEGEGKEGGWRHGLPAHRVTVWCRWLAKRTRKAQMLPALYLCAADLFT